MADHDLSMYRIMASYVLKAYNKCKLADTFIEYTCLLFSVVIPLYINTYQGRFRVGDLGGVVKFIKTEEGADLYDFFFQF